MKREKQGLRRDVASYVSADDAAELVRRDVASYVSTDASLAGELAQQEITGPSPYHFELERRDFFKLMGCGLIVGFAVRAGVAQESGGRGGQNREQMPDDIAPWIHIAETGDVMVYTGKVEVGQNARTSLTQQVAEELHVAPERIQLLMGDTDLTPYDAGTFGSRTTPQMGTQLRKVSALARETLIALAAQRLNAGKSDKLTAENGVVRNPATGRSVTYGELTRGQKLVKLASGDDDPPPLALPTGWRVAGKPMQKVDGAAFVTGEHEYTVDTSLPEMMYGKVLRPPAFRSTMTSFDDSEAKQIPGVIVVRDGNFAGVAAPDLPTAEKAVKALKAQWTTEPQITEGELFGYLKQHPEQGRGGPGEGAGSGGNAYTAGSIDRGQAAADKKFEQTYTVVYIQHAPLEPRAALASWQDGKLHVWTGSQRPFAVKDELVQAFRVSPSAVRVVVPDTGSAYGGKHTGEAAIEAARLAKAAGKPVKLIWTREEEFTWAYFRPAGVIDIKAAVKNDGTMTSWEHDNYNSGPAAIRTSYNIPNQRIQFHPTDAPPLRQGSYRGLAATANFFARESAMDELAHMIGMDPLQFRLKNLTDARLRAVFQAAADRFGWNAVRSTKERGYGMAGGFEKGGYQATFVEVLLTPQVKVNRVVLAWDSGPVINPNGLRNQILGAIVQGLGGALIETVHFDQGKILNPHFEEYPVPRFADTPEIDVVLLDRKDVPPFGAGETPIMGIAPAIANAIHAATGQRFRAMPLPQKLA